jgi:hypothetical protein
MNMNRFNGLYATLRYDSLCLNEIWTNPPGADLERAATPSFVPFMQYAG